MLYMSYTHNDTLIKKTILIPSKINPDNNGITFYTPSEFTTILQNQIYDAYIQDDIQCDIQITFNLKNQNIVKYPRESIEARIFLVLNK